jgi:hypothetical protein
VAQGLPARCHELEQPSLTRDTRTNCPQPRKAIEINYSRHGSIYRTGRNRLQSGSSIVDGPFALFRVVLRNFAAAKRLQTGTGIGGVVRTYTAMEGAA